MDLTAATATAAEQGLTPRGWLVLVLGGIIWVLCYAAACALWPYTACGRCEGSGKRRSPGRKHWRRCKKCKGSGGRVRIGRRIFNFLQLMSRETK